MNDSEKPVLEFPCSFPLKTIGKNTAAFESIVIEIVRRHAPDLRDDAVSNRLSKDGKYMSVTTTFIAQSREQLDALYQELCDHPMVVMVL